MNWLIDFCSFSHLQRVRRVRLQDGAGGRGGGGEAGCQGESLGVEVPVHDGSGGFCRGQVGELSGQHHEQRSGALPGAEGPDPLRCASRAPLPGVALVRQLPCQEVSGPLGSWLLWDLVKCGAGEAEPSFKADRVGLDAHFAQQQALCLPRCRWHPETQERPAGFLLEESRYWLLSGIKQVLEGTYVHSFIPFAHLTTVCMSFLQVSCNRITLFRWRGCFLEPYSHCGSLHAKRLLHQDSTWLTGEYLVVRCLPVLLSHWCLSHQTESGADHLLAQRCNINDRLCLLSLSQLPLAPYKL